MSDTNELRPLDDCPMCAGAGVVHHRVAFSEVVDRPCPACIMVRSLEAQLAALEAENRRLREDGERMRAEIQRVRHEPAAPF